MRGTSSVCRRQHVTSSSFCIWPVRRSEDMKQNRVDGCRATAWSLAKLLMIYLIARTINERDGRRPGHRGALDMRNTAKPLLVLCTLVGRRTFIEQTNRFSVNSFYKRWKDLVVGNSKVELSMVLIISNWIYLIGIRKMRSQRYIKMLLLFNYKSA